MILTELAAKHDFKPTGILHVGASMLEEAEQYRDLGVETVIWVEAQPSSERRQQRAKEFGHVLHEHIPLSDRCEMVNLQITSNEVSTSILPLKRHSVIYPDIVVTEELPLLTVRADDLLNDLPSDVNTLVLDVQGAELRVLKGMGKLLDQIQWVFAEVNLTELYEGCCLKPELDDWMAKHGFTNQEYFSVCDNEWGESLYRK